MASRNQFAGYSLEENNRHASTTDDFYKTLEPENEERDLLVEAVAGILRRVMSKQRLKAATITPESLRRDLESSFLNFVALASLICPQEMPGRGELPAWKVATALGVSRQALSRLQTRWSDFLGGLKTGGMKSELAREISRDRAEGVAGRRTKKTKVEGMTGDFVDPTADERTERIIGDALIQFRAGKPWSKVQRAALRWGGYTDAANVLSEKGLQAVQQGTVTYLPPPQGKESLGFRNSSEVRPLLCNT